MPQNDNPHLLKALYSLPNGHLIIAHDLQDMAIFREPYEHFVNVPEDVRRTWRRAAEMLIAIGDRSEKEMDEADLKRVMEQQKLDDEQVKIVIRELRMMAEGIERYSAFKGASQWTKNIWYAAAEMLEHRLQQVLH